LDAAAKERRVKLRVGGLMRLAAEANVNFWVDEAHCRAIVQFQDRATQARGFIDFCRSSMGMVYNAMFRHNPQPKNFTDLMEKFKNIRDIHSFVKAMVARAKFALI
jgi:hypothetical protein